MTYKMSRLMFKELGGVITGNGRIVGKSTAIKIINESFGLREEIKDIVLI